MRLVRLVRATLLGSVVSLAAPALAQACDTAYWNVKCGNWAVGESHTIVRQGAPPNVRASADVNKWYFGVTNAIRTRSSGEWVENHNMLAADWTWHFNEFTYASDKFGCYIAGIQTIFVNCGTHHD